MKRNDAKRKKRPLSVSRMIALVFIVIILIGTALLMLPAASRNGESCGLMTALFTSTSATCVTGLALADTWTQWSGFGQIVLLCLIEIGGLGFMSAVSTVIFLLRRRVSMQQEMVMAQSIGSDDVGNAVRMQRRVIFGCILTELAGALILAVRFWSEFGLLTALKLGVFHSVSAFCNAGFDILGFIEPGSSMTVYGADPVVILTLSALIVFGGIGFLVWDEIFRIRSPKKWSVYTKLVLIATSALLVGGAILFYISEWNNPATLGGMKVHEKLLAGFFQSVTTRTAGFAGIDQGGLSDMGKSVTMFLMLIGGSSGSTAGGLKTVTFIVIVLFLWTRARGRETVSIFNRTIQESHVLNALTIFGIMVGLCFIGGTVIAATSPVSFTDGLYEAVSAIATVGLTTGITPLMSIPAKLLIIIYMYFGRVGVLTISLGFLQEKKSAQKYRYAETDLLIG